MKSGSKIINSKLCILKKALVSVLVATCVAGSLTGCSFSRYIAKVNEANNQANNQANNEANNQANSETNTDTNNDANSETNSETNNEEERTKDDENHKNESDNIGEELLFGLDLTTVDIYGNPINSSIASESKLIMINFWEPWCGPCVGEMPDLQKLYENYKDQGLIIIGVYYTLEMTDEAIAVMDDCGITYPVIRPTADLDKYTTEYVPTTCFFDGSGYPMVDNSYIGSRSYEDWCSIVEHYLRLINDTY